MFHFLGARHLEKREAKKKSFVDAIICLQTRRGIFCGRPCLEPAADYAPFLMKQPG